jgi:hypothetical protein
MTHTLAFQTPIHTGTDPTPRTHDEAETIARELMKWHPTIRWWVVEGE